MILEHNTLKTLPRLELSPVEFNVLVIDVCEDYLPNLPTIAGAYDYNIISKDDIMKQINSFLNPTLEYIEHFDFKELIQKIREVEK